MEKNDYILMNKQKKQELKFLKYVIKKLELKTWDKSDLVDIYNEFLNFCKILNLDEINLLRKGEVSLGKYCNLDYKNIDEVKTRIYIIFNNIEELDIPICIVLIAAITKLSISEFEGKKNFNDIKNNFNDDEEE